jgi:UDP-N-acetylglucosamine transferase subunit ALG13
MGTLGRLQQSKVLGKSILIFVSVGYQLPFDRLIKAVDNIFGTKQDLNIEVFAQIGSTDYIPKHISYKKFLTEEEFNQYILNANLIVSHAGIGNIIKIIDNNKKAILFPRMVKYNEHRNDHQISTIKAFKNNEGLKIANNDIDLERLINEYLNDQFIFARSSLAPENELFSKIREYINSIAG